MSAAAALLIWLRVTFTDRSRHQRRLDVLTRHRVERPRPTVKVFTLRQVPVTPSMPFARLSLPKGCTVVRAPAPKTEVLESV